MSTQERQEQPVIKRRNSEQKRGEQAWKNISDIKKLDEQITARKLAEIKDTEVAKKVKEEKKLEKEYRSLARGLNAMIQINGLGQTLGFLKAKGKNQEKRPHYLLLQHLTEWMQDPEHFHAINSEVMKKNYDGLLQWVLDPRTGSDDYRRATTECLAFGVWLRRFAEAELKEPEPGENIG